jgi:hypothetical protein
MQHRWITASQLMHRGQLDEPFSIHLATFLNFFGVQALVISPLLFLLAMSTALGAMRRGGKATEGEILLLLLFLVVFIPYAILALHLREEANWPAVSYLGLLVMVAARVRTALPRASGFFIAAYLVAWIESLLLYYVRVLPVPSHLNSTSRLVGWQEIAAHLDAVRREQHAEAVIGDGYKEASILAFYLPRVNFYTQRAQPPATQYDFWPSYPTQRGVPALWITAGSTPAALTPDLNSIEPLERFEILDRGRVLRRYTIYRCENR